MLERLFRTPLLFVSRDIAGEWILEWERHVSREVWGARVCKEVLSLTGPCQWNVLLRCSVSCPINMLVADAMLEAYDMAVARDKALQADALDTLSAKLHALSANFLVAARDPHTDDASIAKLRGCFEATFRCCVTTNLYLSGAWIDNTRDTLWAISLSALLEVAIYSLWEYRRKNEWTGCILGLPTPTYRPTDTVTHGMHADSDTHACNHRHTRTDTWVRDLLKVCLV